MDSRGRTRLPAPLTSKTCDLNGFQFMPILIDRLFGSDFNLQANDSEWRRGVTLWLRAWQQVPAGSLPEDDKSLCQLAGLGTDMQAWQEVKPMALRHWILCSDGRLYHPFLAREVKKAWKQRLKYEREKKLDADRKRLARQRRKQNNIIDLKH